MSASWSSAPRASGRPPRWLPATLAVGDPPPGCGQGEAQPAGCAPESALASKQLSGAELAAWRGYIQSHAAILRELDAELLAAHGIISRDYEVLLHLSRFPDRQLAMSALARHTMLTRSGVTRLIDGLVASGLIQRISSPTDGRVFYAQLTDAGDRKLRDAQPIQTAGIGRLFLAHYSPEEIRQLGSLLSRLPDPHHNTSPTVT